MTWTKRHHHLHRGDRGRTSSTATRRSRPAGAPPGRPCPTGRSASSSWGPSPRTSAPGCRTSSSAPTPTTSRIRARSSASSSSPSSGPPWSCPWWAVCWPTRSTASASSSSCPSSSSCSPSGWPWSCSPPTRRRCCWCVMVLGVGAGSAMFGPTYSAILPGLVGREDLPGAISLNSAQMNASRVIGPVIGGLLYSLVGPAWIFAGNAATYLFVVGALLLVTLPAVPQSPAQASRWRQLTAGITVARQDKVVGRCLVTVFVFSLLALGLHRADARRGGPQPRYQPVQVGRLRDPLRLLRHRRPGSAPSPSGRCSPPPPNRCWCASASSATPCRCARSPCSAAPYPPT